MNNLLSKIFLSITFAFFTMIINAQVGIGTTNPDASSLLEMQSTEKGILIPRMSQADILAISNPANGLQAFNTDTNSLFIYILSDNQWKEMAYDTGVINLPASFTIGAGGSCSNTNVIGQYVVGINLDNTNIITLNATVTNLGTWSVTTNTVNGYSFSGNGVFASTGIQQVTLVGTGTPVAEQNDTFTASAYASSCTFSVNISTFVCGTDMILYDGQTYTTVQIGGQCWMAENLNIGTMVAAANNQTNNGIIEKYCVDDNLTKCTTYGGLYQWNETMQYTNTGGTQGICPSGWHIPTDAEYKTMEMYLGMSAAQANATGWRGTDEGGKLKETGTAHWDSPNTGATNSSGFTLLGTGYRYPFAPYSILNENIITYLWNSTNSSSYKARKFENNNAQIMRLGVNTLTGLSVRCVKN